MKKLMILASFLLIVIACNKNDEPILDETDIKINNGKIQSPQWLVDVIEGIADGYNRSPATGEKIYSTSVTLVKHNNIVYIYVGDWQSSSMVNGHRYFTNTGEQIKYDTALYLDLSKEINRTHVWPF